MNPLQNISNALPASLCNVCISIFRLRCLYKFILNVSSKDQCMVWEIILIRRKYEMHWINNTTCHFICFRKRHDLKTFVTSVMITIAVLDILDVGRILPVLSEDVFGENIFQRVYCTLGVFHELTVAIFLVSMAIAVCVQAGKEQKVSITVR